MRSSIIVAACLCLSYGTLAAAGSVDYGSSASLYLTYAFDAPPSAARASSLHYGLRLDHDGSWQPNARDRAWLEWQFDLKGFDWISINGVPIISRSMILRQSGDESGIGEFLSDNFGTIALGLAGAVLVFTIADAASDKDDGGADFPKDDINCDQPPSERPDLCTQD